MFIFVLNFNAWKLNYRVIVSLEAPNAIRQEIQAVNVDTFGKVFQNLEKRIQVCLDVKETSFSVNYEQVLFCIVYVYKFSSHYLNNIIFIDNSLGSLATESPCRKDTLRCMCAIL